LATELLFILPILILILLAFVEYSFLINAETRLAASAREGTRVAALGGSSTDVAAAVTTILGTKLTSDPAFAITVSYPNITSNPGDPVKVVVSAPAKLLVPNYLCVIGFDISKVTLSGVAVMIIE
jgi:Flp pilus assembly protein TadG